MNIPGQDDLPLKSETRETNPYCLSIENISEAKEKAVKNFLFVCKCIKMPL